MTLNENELRKYLAWKIVIESAPKKYNDNDITYIPFDEYKNPEELASKYKLLIPIARKVFEVMKNA